MRGRFANDSTQSQGNADLVVKGMEFSSMQVVNLAVDLFRRDRDIRGPCTVGSLVCTYLGKQRPRPESLDWLPLFLKDKPPKHVL